MDDLLSVGRVRTVMCAYDCQLSQQISSYAVNRFCDDTERFTNRVYYLNEQKLVKELTEVRHREDQLKSEGSATHMQIPKIKNGKSTFLMFAIFHTQAESGRHNVIAAFCVPE